MGPTRKRKGPTPNRTLLDFFSGTDTINRSKVKASQQITPSVRQTGLKAASGEVIVIDSDSDDGVHGKDNRKRNASLDFMEGISEGSQSLGSAIPLPAYSEEKDTFGVPSELLRPTDPLVETSSNRFSLAHHSLIASEPDHSESMFGVPALLLEQTGIGSQLTERGRASLVVHECMSTVVGCDSVSDAAVHFPVEEWAAGDDELVALEPLDSAAETDEIEREPSDEQHYCPVCGIDLAGTPVPEAQIHVNHCLDVTLRNDNVVMQKYTSDEPSVTSENGGPRTLAKGQGSDLYTVLMNSRTENEVWTEADAAIDPSRGNRRRAPFYKILQGMPIAVDAFCYGTIPGVTAYFLTHAHSDHYTSLESKWKNGPIYCSEETASLIMHMLAVDPKWIHPLPLDTPTMIPNTGGVSVTLIEANHCPGSCLFFFEGQQTIHAGDSAFKSLFIGSSRIFRYLHCGDFRASPRHVLHPAVKGKHIDHIYLDTTYLDPKYMFSPQPLVISACAEIARRLVMGGMGDSPQAHANPNFTIDVWMKSSRPAETGGRQMLQERVLVVVGTYSIGKERIVKGIAQALGAKVYCDPRKTAILRCQADKDLHALLTADPTEANVHVLPLGTVTSDNLGLYLQRFKGTFSSVIGFRPTGWTYSPPHGSNFSASIQSIISRGQSCYFSYRDLQPSQKSSHNIKIFGVPYSEHSSFFELTCFAMSCDWGRMIPTVNVGSPTSRAKIAKWVKRWELEKRCARSTIIHPRAADYW